MKLGCGCPLDTHQHTYCPYSQTNQPGVTPRPQRELLQLFEREVFSLPTSPSTGTSLPPSHNAVGPLSQISHSPTKPLATPSHIHSFKSWLCTWDLAALLILTETIGSCYLSHCTRQGWTPVQQRLYYNPLLDYDEPLCSLDPTLDYDEPLCSLDPTLDYGEPLYSLDPLLD